MSFWFSLRLTPCASRLTVSEMAQDRLEECLQAVVTGTNPGTVEGGKWIRKGVASYEDTQRIMQT